MSIGDSMRTMLVVFACALCASPPVFAQATPRQPVLIARLPAVRAMANNAAVDPTESLPIPGPHISATTPNLPPPSALWNETLSLPDSDGETIGESFDQTPVETLHGAWQTALLVDQQRMAGAITIDAARADMAAQAAQQYPSARLSGQYTLRDNEPSFRASNPVYSFDTPYLQSEDFAFEGRVDVPLYTGGRVTSRIAAAHSRVQMSQYQLARYQLDLKMRVAEDFVAVLRAEQELLLAESHERSLAAHARDTELFHQQQRAPRNDLLAAQVALSDAQHGVIRAHSDLDSAQASYNRQLGRPLDTDVKLEKLRVGTKPYDINSLTAQAEAHRPELAELDARIAAHRHQAESELAENRAQVHMQGAYTFRENRFQSPQGITSAGIGVWWNMFDAGRAKSQAKRESDQAHALAHRTADLRSHIQLEVHQAWLAVKETRQKLHVTRQAIQRAEENLRVTRQRYTNGMATSTDVLNAETLRVQTYHNHNNSVYDGVLAELRLHRAAASL